MGAVASAILLCGRHLSGLFLSRSHPRLRPGPFLRLNCSNLALQSVPRQYPDGHALARNVQLGDWRRRILAPIGGMVVDVFRRQGEWVDPGVAVLRILRIDKLRVEAFLSAREVNRDLLVFLRS